MGTVYEAVDERLSSLVAVKQTLIEDEEMRRAFWREAGLLANMRHACLPKVIDHFSEEDGQFLVMEYISGDDLASLLAIRGDAFPQTRVIVWGNDILRALEYLHRHDPPVLHRDIKPANMKLTEHEELFLLDFGLAKGAVGQMPTTHKSRSVRAFTPVYASLEQIAGMGTDVRSDLYSVGATLYHLITGKTPLDAPSRYSAIEDGHPDPLKPVHVVNPDVSESVSEVISKSMSVSRGQRFSTAREMREALNEAASAHASGIAKETIESDEHGDLSMPKTLLVRAPPSTGDAEIPVADTNEPVALTTLKSPAGIDVLSSGAQTKRASESGSSSRPDQKSVVITVILAAVILTGAVLVKQIILGLILTCGVVSFMLSFKQPQRAIAWGIMAGLPVLFILGFSMGLNAPVNGFFRKTIIRELPQLALLLLCTFSGAYLGARFSLRRSSKSALA